MLKLILKVDDVLEFCEDLKTVSTKWLWGFVKTHSKLLVSSKVLTKFEKYSNVGMVKTKSNPLPVLSPSLKLYRCTGADAQK